ncbi:leucine-rich repeat domain-containing protein [Amycolatopsis thermoflava]|uniref:Leucine-rich repeat domain-containing protein n=1 Tax=Amycolatopsis thermoflava TaxID=84480 RepID=A0A3N2H020_9PSEU|nr:hypothetical protein [Amycolatopsis thermoflava]ROS42258.1 hypothetical protein EDD35_4644 [Amycolatopsis thermoflava]
MRKATVKIRPDTDPATIEPRIAGQATERVLVAAPLPAPVLAAAAEALAAHPGVALHLLGHADPAQLPMFRHVRELALDLPHATAFDVLSEFTELHELRLGRTNSAKPSLAFLGGLPNLVTLAVDEHGRGFESIAGASSLRHLALRSPRAKSLEPLRGHPALETFAMDFGGIRDLTPLAGIPTLRGLALFQIRGLDDLSALADCVNLEAVSLGALKNVPDLQALARHPALRFLILELLRGLDTLAPLATCARLEQLALFDSRPADRRLDVLVPAPSLRHALIGDPYPPAQVDALRERLYTLHYRGENLRGDGSALRVHWRTPVTDLL